MKCFLIYLILVITVFRPQVSLAGYRALVDEFNAYTPPDYILSQDYLPEASQVSAQSQSSSFEKDIKHIKTISDHWRKTLSTNNGQMPLFFTPDAKLLKKYRGAALDQKIALNAIRGSFDLSTLEILAWIRNPTINSAQNNFAASIESFSQVENLDEILRQYASFIFSIKTGVGPMKGQDPVKTKFPFPGTVSLKGQIAQHETEAAWYALEAVRRDVITAARKIYYDLVFNRKAQGITADTVTLFEDLEAVATRRYEAGQTSFQDVVKIQIKRNILQEDMVTLKQKQHSIESRLGALLNIHAIEPIGHPAPFTMDKQTPRLDKLNPVAKSRRQEIMIQQAQLKKKQDVLEMAETMVLPSLTFNYSTFENQAINTVGSAAEEPSFPTSTSASSGAGLPRNVWYGTNDAYIREIRQRVYAQKEILENTVAETLNQVRERWFDLDRALREKTLYQDTVIRLSKSALNVSTSGYESGNVSFADVINSYDLWLSSNLTLEKKISEFYVAWARLEQAVGAQF
jgi:outer membrane protein TolC